MGCQLCLKSIRWVSTLVAFLVVSKFPRPESVVVAPQPKNKNLYPSKIIFGTCKAIYYYVKEKIAASLGVEELQVR